MYALLEVRHSAICTSLGELLSTPLPQTSVNERNKTKKQGKNRKEVEPRNRTPTLRNSSHCPAAIKSSRTCR
jgi:hypothetical protein